MRLYASRILVALMVGLTASCGASSDGLTPLDTGVEAAGDTGADVAAETPDDVAFVHDVSEDPADPLDVDDAAEPDTTDHAPLLCRPCLQDTDCSEVDPGARCVTYGAPGAFCGTPCANADDCPALHDCSEAATVGGDTRLQCVPVTGLCLCRPEFVQAGYATFCENVNGWGHCVGQRVCTDAGLGDCDAPVPQEEACNGHDDDCDGATDEGVDAASATAACKTDGVCAAGVPVVCAGLAGWSCDYEAVAGYSPVDEHCGECQDNDCDGATDEDAADCGDVELPLDYDCDGLLPPNDNCPGVPNLDQANFDGDGAGDACDADDDNDGVADADDCEPRNPAAYPQAAETCDGLDTNCNGVTDENFADTDDDGQADCVDPDDDDDGSADGDDCAPQDDGVFPGNPEVCDGVDQDCDQLTDEGSPEGTPLACALAGGDAGVCVDGACVDPCDAGVDLPDDDFVDANCDGIDGHEALAVFVAPLQHGGDDFNPGTRDLPKLTIQEGIDTALAEGKTQVLVSAGTYEGPVTLAAAIGVYGGFHKPVGWLRAPEYVTTVEVTAPDAQGAQIGVVAHDLSTDTPTAFDRFHVVLADNVAAGGSNYGVHALDAPGLVLSNLVLEIGKAGDGTSRTTPGAKPTVYGAAGTYGESGSESDTSAWCKQYGSPDTGDGGAKPACPWGASAGWGGWGGSAGYHDGKGSSGSAGGSNGDSTATGGSPGDGHYGSGDAGAPGTSGAAGINGSSGAAFGAFEGGLYAPANGGHDLPATDGKGGAGGGGGGGGGGGVNGTVFTCYGYGGAGGGGGAGGCGGQRGLSGDGGGAAFGVLAVGGQPVVRAIDATLAGGGAGGAASKGGDGTTGGSGGSGGGTSVENAGSGGPGGKGGDGGRGGHGGGGGGGPSFCVYHVLVEGSPVSALMQDITCTNGGGGAGGASVGSAGVPGASGDSGFCLEAECAF